MQRVTPFIYRYLSLDSLLPVKYAGQPLPPASKLFGTAFALTWPAGLEAGLVAIGYSIDTAVVGTLGTVAMNAVGITVQPRLIVQCFAISLNIGVTAVIARQRGADNQEEANRCLKQAIILSILISFFSVLVAWLAAWPLLRLAGAAPVYIADSVTYFRIVLPGLFFYNIGLTVCAAQRGVGNTKTSLMANLAAIAVKILLAYSLIGGRFGLPALGFTGVAVASVIGHLVGFAVAFSSVLKRHSYIHVRRAGSWRPQAKILSGITKVGGSALAEQLFLRLGMLIYIRLVSGLGTVAYTSYIICDSIITISYGISLGLGDAAAALTGQALGAERKDLAIIYGGICRRFSITFSFCFSVGCFILRRQIVGMFSANPLVIALGEDMMLAVVAVTLAQGYQAIYAGCLRGAGDTKYVAYISLVSLAILRPIFSWALCYPLGLGILGAWISMLLDQSGRLYLLQRRFSSDKWLDYQF